MSKTISTTVYEYDELNDKAKAKARVWFYEACSNDSWWTSTYEDAERAGIKITEFDCGRSNYIKGDFIKSPHSSASLITQEHGESCETYKTAKQYLGDAETLSAKYAGGTEDSDYEHDKAREELDAEFKRSILEDYLILLRNEMEYLSSDEYLEEGIHANEYTFTEDGKRFG